MYGELLRDKQFKWVVTGAAGFIGSHLCQALVKNRQNVIGFDNFATGFQSNIDAISQSVETGSTFDFVKGDIRDQESLLEVFNGADYVLHQAALGSVPRSIENPIESQDVNVSGFLKVIHAAYKSQVKNFVYASSSSVYGDSKASPKREQDIGQLLSPYALTKKDNEEWAKVFSKCYDFKTTGLRYFNVFGPRQSEKSRYAAVFPKWFSCIRDNIAPVIFGDGKTSRDFCFIENVIQANVRAALGELPGSNVYNVSLGGNIELSEALSIIRNIVKENGIRSETQEPKYEDFRPGDIRHSSADISQIKRDLNYNPSVNFEDGMRITVKAFFS